MQRFIIERYLIRESLQNFLAVISVLMLIYISNRFVRFLAEAAAGELDSSVIFELLLLKVMANCVALLPLSFFIGVLLAMGRLSRDSEIVAMQAGGVGVQCLVRGILAIALVFGLLVGVMSMYVAPMAAGNAAEMTRQARNDSDVTGIYPGRFKDFGEGEHIIYVQDVTADRTRMSNVFVQVRRQEELDIVFAEAAHQFVDNSSGDRFMVLRNGHRYEGEPGSADFVIHAFETHGVRIRKQVGGPGYRDPEELTVWELLGGLGPIYAAELQWRVSLAVSAVLLALLAIPLARTSARSGKYGKLFMAVLIYFVYSNVMSIALKAVERGDINPIVGVWPVHITMALAVAVMLFAMSGGLSRVRGSRAAQA